MGSLQVPNGSKSPLLLETSCGYLLQELQMIWDEVGEDQFEREKVLLDIEQECLEVYRRKVDNANISRARLHQELADAQAEFTHLLLSLGERSLPLRPEKMAGTLKEQLHSISPALKEMQLRREGRVKQFRAVQSQIQKISGEIAGRSEYNDTSSSVVVNESDLSLKKLEEFQNELQTLQNEKSDRLQRVEKYMGTIQNLSATLGMDPSMIITKVHPSLNALSGLSKNIGDVILAKLHSTVESLETEKQKRLDKLHQLGKTLINLWNLMDTHHQDRQRFSHVTGLSSVSSSDVCTPGSLTLDIIQQAEVEVNRLDQLKASKMKELFLRKQLELEEICNQSHVEIPSRPEIENLMDLINSGEIDHADLLMTMDDQISKALEEACSRKPIMEKVEKWILASEEERWLEEYNRDENRYSVSRGAHRNLKRAERARLMVNKIPALVDLLIAKTKNWEEERNKVFLYDEVPLLAMLEEYNTMRREREEEKQRQREMKKIQTQAVVLITDQGHAFGSRPSSRAGYDSPMNSRRLSVGSQLSGMVPSTLTSPMHGNSIPFSRGGRKARGQRASCRAGISSHLREDTASVVSSFSGPRSP